MLMLVWMLWNIQHVTRNTLKVDMCWHSSNWVHELLPIETWKFIFLSPTNFTSAYDKEGIFWRQFKKMNLLTQRWNMEFLTDFFSPVTQVFSDTCNLCNINLKIHAVLRDILAVFFKRNPTTMFVLIYGKLF